MLVFPLGFLWLLPNTVAFCSFRWAPKRTNTYLSTLTRYAMSTVNTAPSQDNEINWLDDKSMGTSSSPPDASVFNIPLFPADDFVPFPTGHVPIHVVEEEGLAMLTDIFASHAQASSIEYCDIESKKKYSLSLSKPAFGMVLRENGRIATTGTLLTVLDHDTYEDNSHSMHCEGGQRFRILSIVQQKPYLIARVQFPVVDTDLPVTVIARDSINDKDAVKYEKQDMNDRDSDFENPLSNWEELKQLELAVWRNFTDVIELTQQYSGFISNEQVPEAIYRLAPIDSNDSDLTRSTLNNHQFQSNMKLPTTIGDDQTHQECVDNKERLQKMSDFSFALADMLVISSDERQLVLQSNSVADRLSLLSQMLSKSRNFLKSVLFEGVTATIESVKGGYLISKPEQTNNFQ